MTAQPSCALCCSVGDLRESHILPAFVYRWLKETSATGFLRAGENPRKRVQDGLKMPLLCAACEGRFSKWETEFANEVFYPYNVDPRLRYRYGPWMLKFCVSISWRVLKFFMLKTNLEGWNEDERADAAKALEQWRAFLFDEVPHPGLYEQHLLPLGEMESVSFPDLPKNMNRYLMRGVEIDVAHGEISAFSYAKMGRFALFGVIRPTMNRWEGTRVAVKSGLIKPSRFVVPIELGDYLMDRARRLGELTEAIPDHQRDKIEADIVRDPTRLIASDEFRAMMNDERMFGLDAVIRKPKKVL